MKKIRKMLVSVLLVLCLLIVNSQSVSATSQSKKLKLPGSYGKLTANVWRDWTAETCGNTKQWEYQVSAVYTGSKKVSVIKTTWTGSASLKNSGSISLGVKDDGVEAGGSSAWTYVTTAKAYWCNKNGAKTSTYRSNMIVCPKCDYRPGTVAIVNTAYLKLKCDQRTWSISAGV